jgi:hypothetical protein
MPPAVAAIVDACALDGRQSGLELAEKFGDISNDVGTVKAHFLRSGRRSRLS